MEEIRKNLIKKLSSQGKKRAVVAMSGGVDSSVVAALLHDVGHDVIGITLQLYSVDFEIQNKSKTCCAGKDIYDAQLTASKIGIPHYVFNYEHNFKAEVIDKFADSYIRGETPIPCVLCNQTVKFRDLLKATKDLDADMMATGHYVQKINNNGIPELHMGQDPQKDQSYFLFATTKEQLSMLEFPLGGLTKDQTRQLAKYYGLIIADKPDSQDICFVPNGNYRELVQKLRPESNKKGNIVLHDGTIVGQHDGIINYTVGQRKGLNISHSEPLYVIRIDAKNNEIIIGEADKLGGKELFIDDVNWLIDSNDDIECKVKLRSAHSGSMARISKKGNGAVVNLYDSYPGITPGQACVMYDDTRVLGGGWIREIAI